MNIQFYKVEITNVIFCILFITLYITKFSHLIKLFNKNTFYFDFATVYATIILSLDIELINNHTHKSLYF